MWVIFTDKPIPVAAQCGTCIYGRSLAVITGANPAGSINVCFLWVLCVLKVEASAIGQSLDKGSPVTCVYPTLCAQVQLYIQWVGSRGGDKKKFTELLWLPFIPPLAIRSINLTRKLTQTVFLLMGLRLCSITFDPWSNITHQPRSDAFPYSRRRKIWSSSLRKHKNSLLTFIGRCLIGH